MLFTSELVYELVLIYKPKFPHFYKGQNTIIKVVWE